MLVPLLLQLAIGTTPATASDSLLMRGVSHQLARYRAERVSNVRYDLNLDVTRPDVAFGSVRVSFDRTGDGDAILDFRGRGLADVVVNGTRGADAVFDGAHLRVPATTLKAGTNTLEMVFQAPIAPAGASIIRFTDDIDKRSYLYTLLVPSDANLLFPCFDQPDIKAVFALTLTVPNGWSALSNGATITEATAGDNTQFVFAPSKRISTYLFAFAAGPYQKLRDGDINLWVRPSRAREAETDTLIALNRRAKDWLANYFDVPYPFDKFDFLLAPAFPFGGMEHPGAIFYNEETFIYREPPTAVQRLGRQATINHEVAHQWFGDFTTMRWFDDLWLKEGFATYMAAKMQAATGDTTAWMSFYLRNKPAAYDVDASSGTNSVWQELANLDQAKSNYGAIVYNKAPGVLKQLNYLVGEAAFKRGVHDFLTSHAFGNGTWQELLASVGAAAGRDLTDWGRAYFVRPGMPVIEQKLTVVNGKIDHLMLIQRPAQALSGKGIWPMRLELRLQYGGASPVTIPVEVKAETTLVAAARGLPAPQFAYANANDYGYGLFMLDDRSRDWLLTNKVAVRDPFLRAMLWGSLWDLVRDARLDPERYAEAALAALPTERDEQIASRILGRLTRAVDSYVSPARRVALAPRVESMLLTMASDTARSYGVRKSNFDTYVSFASSPAALARLNAWLDSSTAAGAPLRQPTRWSIVTQLATRGHSTAEARLTGEIARDTTTGGRRRAFIAGAAFPRAEVKRDYFARYFSDNQLNEDWVTASMGSFNNPDQGALTLAYLRPALDTLRWVQQNRRIFFLGSWLGGFIGGQRSADGLAAVDKYLTDNPGLARDLRLKVLQARDDLERTVRIRAAFARTLP